MRIVWQVVRIQLVKVILTKIHYIRNCDFEHEFVFKTMYASWLYKCPIWNGYFKLFGITMGWFWAIRIVVLVLSIQQPVIPITCQCNTMMKVFKVRVSLTVKCRNILLLPQTRTYIVKVICHFVFYGLRGDGDVRFVGNVD
jgi:hypothetical protein